MSEAVGSVHYDIGLNTSKFDSAQSKINSKLGHMGGNFQKLGATLVTFAKRATIAGAVASAAFVGFGLKTAGDLESARQGFITLLGSAKETDEVLAQIKKDAAKTPFELTGLIQANQLLTSVTKDGKRSEEMLLNVGKTLAAMGKGQPELDRIIVNLQQIGAVGHASAMDIKQFAFAGIPIYKMLEKATGKTGEALSEMISNGEVSFEVLEKMFKKAGTGSGQFAKAFESKSGIFNQLVSNMKDNFTIFASDFVKKTGIFDTAKQAIGKLNDVVSANSDSMVKSFVKGKEKLLELYQAVALYLQPKIESLWKSIKENIIPILNELWKKVIEPMIPVIGETLVFAIGAVVDVLKIVSDSIGWWIKQLKQNNIWIHLITDAFTALAAAMAIDKAFTMLAAGFKALTTSVIPKTIVKMTVLKKLVSTPMVMPAIAIGAALIAIQQVMDAHSRMQQAIKGAKTARENLLDITKKTNRHFLDVYYNSVSTKEQKEKAKIFLHRAGVKGFANGVRDFSGGWAVVGERGPELLNLPKGSNVFSNGESKSMGSNIHIGTINNASDEAYLMRRIDTNIRFNTRGVAPA